MIFYKRITICNLFAYNDIQSINFDQMNNKNIYLLFGKNGFGKTSFIRSIKLLFAGSGMLSDSKNVPDIVLNFINNKSPGRFSPEVLLLGQNAENGWQGVFNKTAIKNDENKFFVELILKEDGNEIVIRREWNRYPSISEKLIFIKNGEQLTDNLAKDECEQILPLNFLQFFVFDGEEIEAMADEISTQLKDKIQSMLNISVLDKLNSEISSIEKDFIKQSNLASENKAQLIRFEGELGSKKEELENTINNIKFNEDEIKEKIQILTSKKNERDTKIKNNSKESESLQNAKNQALNDLETAKKHIVDFGGEILFLGINETISEALMQLSKNIDTSSFNAEEMTKLAKFSTEFLMQKIKFDGDSIDLNNALRDAFLEFIRKGGDNKFKGLNKTALNAIYVNANENSDRLLEAISNAKNAKNSIFTISSKLDNFISDSAIENEIKKLDEEIESLENEKIKVGDELKNNHTKKTTFENEIYELEREIIRLKDEAGRDKRIKNQLELLKQIKEQINIYKQGRIERTTKRLKKEIYENYKRLLPNDNVDSIDIQNFVVKLINQDGEAIAVKSQSAGQKQIAAISIFWALSKLSNRRLPLIIDTPLARLDAENRKNVIQNYYQNSSNQVIVLPTDTEFTKNEIEYAGDKIAGIYEIINDENKRDHAKIIKKDSQC
jgi:hypothetical protein